MAGAAVSWKHGTFDFYTVSEPRVLTAMNLDFGTRKLLGLWGFLEMN